MKSHYTTIQSVCRSFWLQFLHGDNSDWDRIYIWLLKFSVGLLVWFELQTVFAVWLAGIPYEALGPVWLNLFGLELRAPWAANALFFRLHSESFAMIVVLRVCGVIMLAPALWLALFLAGPLPKWPKKRGRYAYGGHLLDQGGSSGVIVGHAKGIPWQKMPDLVRLDPSTDILILGSGLVANGVFQAALKSFEGAILRFGSSKLAGDVIDDRDIWHIAQGASANFPLDPLPQVRAGVLAWGDVWAMLSPCGFNERQRVLATALLVRGLETARPVDRTFFGVMSNLATPDQLYTQLSGWLAGTEILKPGARDQLTALLAHWAQAQEQVAEDLELIPKRLWATQRGWRYHLSSARLPCLANICECGPRVLSFDIRPKDPNDAIDPDSLPLMHAILRLRALMADATTPGTRPVLIAIEGDMPDQLALMIKAGHADLKKRGVSFLVQGRSTAAIRTAFDLKYRETPSAFFGTVIMTKKEISTSTDVIDRSYISSEAVKSVRPDEIIIVQTHRRPVRLHPAEPSMLARLPFTATDQTQRPEPWSEAAVAYPLGASLPKQVAVKIPNRGARSRKKGSPVYAQEAASPVTPKPKSLVTKDDLTSGTARLKRALAKRANGTSPSQPRLI